MADIKKVLQRIEEAAKYGLTELNLSSSRLTRLPPEISKLVKLERLNLLGNELTSLPPEISKLTKLTEQGKGPV